MRRGDRPALTIDVLVASGKWKRADKSKAIVRHAVTQAAAMAPAGPASTTGTSTKAAELAIVLSDDSGIRLLNRDWRGIDKATNVLSFPAKNASGHLGDVVLAFETIAREARAEEKPFAHHLAHLAVHGFLHLVGYDHIRSKDAAAMERTEREILRELSIPDPYRTALPKPRAAAGKPKAAGRAAKSSR
jgi:probable rRNA maturation factor